MTKGAVLVAGLEPALVACSCDPDLDTLRCVLWYLLGPDHGPLTSVIDATLARPDDKGAIAITGATWADAAGAIATAKGARGNENCA